MADPGSRDRRTRVLAAAVVVLVVAGVIAVVTRGSADDRAIRVGAGGAAPPTSSSPTTPTVDPTSTSTAVAEATVEPPTTTAATAVATPKPTVRPTPVTTAAPSPPPTTAPASTATTGQVITVPASGLYAVEVATGALVRLGDTTPFDVAGNRVLTATGTTVSSRPIAGGDEAAQYTLGGAERIDWLEAADDGTAVVRMATPVRDSSGRQTGAQLYTKLVGPTGDVRIDDLPVSGEVEWAGDGTTLVMNNWQGVRAYRASGQPAWGPIAAPESIMKGLRVSYDGGLVTGEFNSHAVKLLDVSTQQWRDTPLWRAVSFGPGPRLMGQPSPPPGWNGRDPLGMSTWTIADDSRSAYCRTGSEPAWAPDGQHAIVLDSPLVGRDDGSRFSFRIRDAGGTARYTLSYAHGPFGRDGNVNNVGLAITGPRWSADGRYVVVAAM